MIIIGNQKINLDIFKLNYSEMPAKNYQSVFKHNLYFY